MGLTTSFRPRPGDGIFTREIDETLEGATVSEMKTRSLSVILGSLVLTGSASAALFPQGFADHTLCCGTGPMAAAAAARHGAAGGGESSGGGNGVASAAVAPATLAVAVPGVGPTALEISAPEQENGYLKLGFDRLAGFKFIAPEFDPAANPNVQPPTGNEQIPAIVKSWSGKKALITGFMQPTKLENGKCTEFMLMASQMACCFGGVPNINDWVIVRMPKGVPVMMDVPVSFYGTLKVGATFENGYLTGIYEMEGEKMGEVKG